jgi:hypothetical protein
MYHMNERCKLLAPLPGKGVVTAWLKGFKNRGEIEEELHRLKDEVMMCYLTFTVRLCVRMYTMSADVCRHFQ